MRKMRTTVTRQQAEAWADDALAVIYKETGTLAPLKRRPPRSMAEAAKRFREEYAESVR